MLCRIKISCAVTLMNRTCAKHTKCKIPRADCGYINMTLSYQWQRRKMHGAMGGRWEQWYVSEENSQKFWKIIADGTGFEQRLNFSIKLRARIRLAWKMITLRYKLKKHFGARSLRMKKSDELNIGEGFLTYFFTGKNRPTTCFFAWEYQSNKKLKQATHKLLWIQQIIKTPNFGH